jgi:hypothetical protein
MMTRATISSTICALTLSAAVPAHAQLNGSHTLGDFGVQAGTQPQPGFYASLFYYRYDTDTIRNAGGEIVRLPTDSRSSIGITATAPILWYVSDAKILGANFGVMAVLPWANASLEAPAFEFSQTRDMSFTDILIRPVDLGWHTGRADISAGFQFYAPTGRYERGGRDNIGKGMWTYEPFVGTTLYFDKARTTSVATTAFWEIHSEKKDTNVKVGQILTLEGGGGKAFLGGGLIVGAAYYAQWKLTEDQLGSFGLPGGGSFDPRFAGKHKVFALGPDVTVPVATKTKLFALVNVRYFWEAGARSKTEGQTLTVTATFPIPSVRLP